MTYVTIHDDTLVVEPKGLDKLWSLKSRLDIPLAHVVPATVEPYESRRIVFSLRFPGTHIPGLIKAGTF